MMHATADTSGRAEPAARHLRAVRDDEAADPVADAREQVIAVYEEAYAGVARLAYLLVADRHLAEDLAHDAFATLYEKWEQLEDHSKAAGYVRTTVTNLAMSAHRRSATARKHLALQIAQDGNHTADSAEHEVLRDSARPDVVAALQTLSPKQRSAVVLRYWLRYTETEIAETIGCSVGSVRTHLHRGHAALAELLGEHR